MYYTLLRLSTLYVLCVKEGSSGETVIYVPKVLILLMEKTVNLFVNVI